MEQAKIDQFMMMHGTKFFPMHLQEIRNRLTAMDDNQAQMAMFADYKDPNTLLLISIFLGYLGIDRFMIGDTGFGVLKLLTGGMCGIWALIDWFLISDATRDKNFQLFLHSTMRYR